MPDLHAWITQQVDRTETTARGHQQASPTWAYDDLAREVRDQVNSGTVAFAPHQGDGEHIALHDPSAVLRRCAADRRILDRHTLDPDVTWEPACLGCGTTGDIALSVTDNLNECPELLDLAHAHGITDDQLAGLDRPQAPERPHFKTLAEGGSVIAALLRHFEEQAFASASASAALAAFGECVGTGAPLGLLGPATREPTPVELALGILDPHLRRCSLYQPGPGLSIPTWKA
ncbi:DUF6221 family protein [Streptomyces sp. H27-C3]|uniref:DUF6221 family protein n=1 Tax=Streptomyces sp. H27-C3 TaxID=3046305 RepID=UPI0024BAC0E7|nr:DUF6221 family protein [Streptomyces sp. H27-C3]MDJ0460619.1 DUF6221 family protein [Streptomyces sp. H27-C3]